MTAVPTGKDVTTSLLYLNSPKQALQAMVDAGAVFMVRRRHDALGLSFSYRVTAGGDVARCREVLAAVKSRPQVFLAAFKAHVQDAACAVASKGEVQTSSCHNAVALDVGDVQTSPTPKEPVRGPSASRLPPSAAEHGAQTPSSASIDGLATGQTVGVAQTPATRPDIEGDVSTSPSIPEAKPTRGAA